MLKKINSEPKYHFTKEQAHNLSKLRIIQKNLVHLQGFPDSLNDENILLNKSKLGQFGKILKIILVSKNESEQKKKTNSAYITYSKNEEAALAILSMDSLIIEGHLIRAFFGTTKYCVHFLNNNECKNKEKCMFIHYIANDNDVLGINSKFDYNDHINLAKQILTLSNFEYKNFNFNFPIKTIQNFLIKEDISDINITNSSVRKHSSSSNSSNNPDKKDNPIKNKNLLFKHKSKSRFFCKHNSKCDDNNSVKISSSIKNLIDNVCIRIPFFSKFGHFFNNKQYEIEFYKKKYENINDPLIKYVFDNTF